MHVDVAMASLDILGCCALMKVSYLDTIQILRHRNVGVFSKQRIWQEKKYKKGVIWNLFMTDEVLLIKFE